MTAVSNAERRRIIHAATKSLYARLVAITDDLQAERLAHTTTKKDLEYAKAKDADRLQSINLKDMQLDAARSLVKDREAERDRLMRLVDQLTSVSIVPHGARIDAGAFSNLPKDLRRT